MTHYQRLAQLAAMVDQTGRAIDVMEQITGEAEGRPNWKFLQSRITALEKRIGKLCDEAQERLCR